MKVMCRYSQAEKTGKILERAKKIESQLKRLLGKDVNEPYSLHTLITEARNKNLISFQQARDLHYIKKIRNQESHASGKSISRKNLNKFILRADNTRNSLSITLMKKNTKNQIAKKIVKKEKFFESQKNSSINKLDRSLLLSLVFVSIAIVLIFFFPQTIQILTAIFTGFWAYFMLQGENFSFLIKLLIVAIIFFVISVSTIVSIIVLILFVVLLLYLIIAHN